LNLLIFFFRAKVFDGNARFAGKTRRDLRFATNGIIATLWKELAEFGASVFIVRDHVTFSPGMTASFWGRFAFCDRA
jgi:hypothetical protein